MHIALRIAAIIYIPAAIGVLDAIVNVVNWKLFNNPPDLPSILTSTSSWIAIFLCLLIPFICMRPYQGKFKIVKVLIAIALIPYTLNRFGYASSEYMSYLGVSCCRTDQATLATTSEVLLSPISPFYRFTL
jgi:hypothetical protein